jgi:tripartite-type tricarboxylate transporter receptor subunit TctC
MKRSTVIAMLVLSTVAATAVAAQSGYPTRPVRVVIPFPPGGTSDILTRIMAEKLTPVLGQQVIVDNRPGAGGVIATDIVAKAAPDGHTLYMAFVSHAINPYVYVKLPYDTVKDFAPIALFAISPNVVVINPALPVASITELIAFAKSKPGQINYASAGIGTNSHLSAELLAAMAGIKMVHVPYKGGPQANADVAAGTVQMHIPSMPVAMPLIKAGRLRAIAVTSTKRSPALPDVPTVAETIPGYESLAWYGFIAPRGTPRAIIERLSSEVATILRRSDVIESMSVQGADPTYMGPQEFGEYISAELKRWESAVKAAGLKPGSL